MSRRRQPPRPRIDPPGRESRWAPLAWHASFLLLVFLVGCVQIEDPDIWWHLRTGQLIWQRGQVPRTDWFTYTNPDSPWIDLHWGFQLFAAALWAIGGAPALVIAKSLFAVATFAVAMLASRRTWPAWQSVACWLPALLIFSGRNQVRPEMFSLLFLAAEAAILFHARTRPLLAWFFPIIQVIWINVHGLYVLGLVLWVCFVVGEIVRSTFERRDDAEERPLTWAVARRWLMITASLLAVALANPYCLDGALFPLTLLTRIEGPDHAFYSQFSGEFRGIREFIAAYGVTGLFQNLTTLSLVVLFGLTWFSFVPRALVGRFDFYRLLSFLAFSWLALQANRNAVLFALVSGTVLRANVGEWLERRRNEPHRFAMGQVLTAAVLGLLIIAVPFDLLSVLRPAEIPRLFGVSEIPGAFPHQAAEFLDRADMPRRCYALDEGAAAVYIFHNGPQGRAFADARLEVNTRETLERYLAIEQQLIAGDPHVFGSLTQDIPPDADGKAEVPALLIALRYLATNPKLQQGLAKLTRFRRVYVDHVAVVLIEESRANALGLDTVRE